jgi:hypothetical protein
VSGRTITTAVDTVDTLESRFSAIFGVAYAQGAAKVSQAILSKLLIYKYYFEGDGILLNRRPVLDTGLGCFFRLLRQNSLTPCQARGDEERMDQMPSSAGTHANAGRG